MVGVLRLTRGKWRTILLKIRKNSSRFHFCKCTICFHYWGNKNQSFPIIYAVEKKKALEEVSTDMDSALESAIYLCDLGQVT